VTHVREILNKHKYVLYRGQLTSAHVEHLPYFFKAGWLPLNGNVNCHNERYLLSSNPYKVYYFPMDDLKLEVWCEVNAHTNIRSCFRRKKF
jgi:hypothetical protein